MKKIIKSILLVVLVVIMGTLLIPESKAQAEDEKYTVYAKVPTEWGTPYIWAWKLGGTLFSEWPGAMMNDNGDGWYSYDVNSEYIDIIVSNGASSQTSDIRVNGNDVEIIVSSDNSYMINYRENYSDDFGETITLTVDIPADWKHPYIWAWSDENGNVFQSWPGVIMNPSGDDYAIDLPNWVTGVIISATGDTTHKTMDIFVEPGKNIWLTVNNENDVRVSYFSPAGDSTPEVDVPDVQTPSDEVTPTVPMEQDNPTVPQATQGQGGGTADDDGKPDTKRLLYILIPIGVFVVIILIVTFTGNGKGKKHAVYTDDDVNVDVDVDDIDI